MPNRPLPAELSPAPDALLRLEPLPPMPVAHRERLSALVLDQALRVFGDAVAALIVKGSACKGDFIPGYSDFDCHVFLRPNRVPMLDGRTPGLEHALAFQSGIGKLDPAAFGVSDIQVYFIDAGNYPPDWTPPLPGTYEVACGELPTGLPPVDPAALVIQARAFFPRASHDTDGFAGRIIDKPDGRLADVVRLFGTGVKPALYHAAILRGAPPVDVWRRPLAEVLPLVEPEWCPSRGFTRFFAEARDWRAVCRQPDRLRAMFRVGYYALRETCEHAGLPG